MATRKTAVNKAKKTITCDNNNTPEHALKLIAAVRKWACGYHIEGIPKLLFAYQKFEKQNGTPLEWED